MDSLINSAVYLMYKYLLAPAGVRKLDITSFDICFISNLFHYNKSGEHFSVLSTRSDSIAQ